MKKFLLALLLLVPKAEAQVNQPIIRMWDSVNGKAVSPADFTSRTLRITCISGCGGAAAFNDNTAFTFGTTSIGNIGFVVDDVGTNAVAENFAGTPRMTDQRIIYVDLSKTGANTTALLVTGTGGTFPVTGGFLTDAQLRATPVPVSLAGANDVDVISAIPGTGATNLGKAEDTGHTTGDTGVFIQGVRTDPTTTAYTTATTEYSPIAVDYVGAISNGAHPGRFSCFLPLTTTATTQCQAAPAAGLRAYVTSVHVSNGAATVQGVDIVYGTGANCVTGITAITHKFQMGTNGLTTSPIFVSATFGDNTPLVPAAANAICCRPTAATAFGCTITGFVAP